MAKKLINKPFSDINMRLTNTLTINRVYIALYMSLLILLSSCEKKEKEISSYDVCIETLPPFKEKFNNISDAKLLKSLCKCIWQKFPINGWERKVSKKLYKGEDIGWKIKSFSTVFEENLKSCKEIILRNE